MTAQGLPSLGTVVKMEGLHGQPPIHSPYLWSTTVCLTLYWAAQRLDHSEFLGARGGDFIFLLPGRKLSGQGVEGEEKASAFSINAFN